MSNCAAVRFTGPSQLLKKNQEKKLIRLCVPHLRNKGQTDTHQLESFSTVIRFWMRF